MVNIPLLATDYYNTDAGRQYLLVKNSYTVSMYIDGYGWLPITEKHFREILKCFEVNSIKD
jgi:hypothetical protein